MTRELHDQEKYPHENVNTADKPKYKQDVQRLPRMLKREWRAALPK